MRRSWVGRSVEVAITCLAAYGLFALISGPLARFTEPLRTAGETVNRLPSPDGQANARIEQAHGWGGTTTRVTMQVGAQAPWTVYEAHGNGAKPTIAWLNPDVLLIDLPCAPFDQVADPDRGSGPVENGRRHVVRFFYSDPKCVLPHRAIAQ